MLALLAMGGGTRPAVCMASLPPLGCFCARGVHPYGPCLLLAPRPESGRFRLPRAPRRFSSAQLVSVHQPCGSHGCPDRFGPPLPSGPPSLSAGCAQRAWCGALPSRAALVMAHAGPLVPGGGLLGPPRAWPVCLLSDASSPGVSISLIPGLSTSGSSGSLPRPRPTQDQEPRPAREDGGGPPCPCIEHRDVKRGQYLPVLVPRVPPGGGSRPRCGSTGVFTWGHSGGLDRLGWPSLHVPRLGARHPFAGGTLASRFLSCGRWGVASCCPGDPLPLLVLLFLLSWSLSSVERGWDKPFFSAPVCFLGTSWGRVGPGFSSFGPGVSGACW